MKKGIRLMAAILALCMSLSLAACGGSSESEPEGEADKPVTEDKSDAATDESTEEEGNPWDNTTLNDYLGATPNNWSPAEWVFDTDRVVLDRIQSNFWSFEVNEAGDNFDTYCDAAAALPEDISADYAGQYDIPADAENGDGWAYRVTLRQDLKWDDGTPINANDFVESMKRMLDPKTKASRGNEYYESTVSLANARNYFWQGEDEDGETVPTEWDQVGLKAADDYTLIYILSKPVSTFYMTYGGNLPLLKPDLYDGGMESTGELQKTDYCTTLETTASWGPFKMDSFQENKAFRMSKNENWYGWNDPEYAGREHLSYDGTNTQIIAEHATAVQLFQQGKLDILKLEADDMEVFGASDYMLLTPTSYCTRLSFNSDYETLKSFETEGVCKVMPSYLNFRKAFSRAINRKEYVSTCTAMDAPCLGLFNEQYISDPANGTLYRDAPGAQHALLAAYSDGTGDVSKLTGYDLEEARQLFQLAYEEAKANGDYKDGDLVELKLMVFSDSQQYQKIVNHMHDKLAEATIGTGFEGHTKVTLVADEDFWGKAAVGEYEAIMAAYSGNEMDAPSLLTWYTDEAWHVEYGFIASEEPITVNIEGEDVTMSYKDMNLELCEGRWANADPALRAEIMAAIEEGLLCQYRTIPLKSKMNGNLLSHRMSYESDEYLPNVQFGAEIMSMNDAEWEAYVEECGGKLEY